MSTSKLDAIRAAAEALTAPSLAEQIEACERYAMRAGEYHEFEYEDALRAAAVTLRSLAEPPTAEPTQCGARRMVNRLLALQPRVRTGVTFVLVDICDRDEVQMLRNCADYVKQAAMPSTMGMESSQEDTDGSAAAPIAEPSDGLVGQLDALLANELAQKYPLMADVVRNARDRIVAHVAGQRMAMETMAKQETRIAALEQQLAAAQADARRMDWLAAWRSGDVAICPPGQHGGNKDGWLVHRDRWVNKGIEFAGEWEGPTLRDAIDAAQSQEPRDA